MAFVKDKAGSDILREVLTSIPGIGRFLTPD